MPICRVCGAPHASKHYGSVCCSGCKGFFRRSVRFRKEYGCARAHNCPVNQKYRNLCRACRFQKCIAVGMDTRLVQGDWGHAASPIESGASPPQLLSVEKEDGPSTTNGTSPPNLSTKDNFGTQVAGSEVATALPCQQQLLWHNTVLNSEMDSNRALGYGAPAGSSSFHSSALCPNAQSVVAFFVAIERFCDLYVDNRMERSSGAVVPPPNLDVPVQLAYRQPGIICERSPMGWSDATPMEPSALSRVYSRLMVHYFDWASHLPELSEFCEADRLNLICRRALRCIWLLITFRAVPLSGSASGGGIPLTCERFFPASAQAQARLEPQLRDLFADTINMALQEMVRPMREMGITEEEYAMLRVLCFFSPVPCMSADGRARLRRAQDKYLGVLTDLVSARHGGGACWAPAGVRRMNQLLMMLSRAEQIAQLDDNAFSVMVSFNIAQMRGTLTYEMHLRGN